MHLGQRNVIKRGTYICDYIVHLWNFMSCANNKKSTPNLYFRPIPFTFMCGSKINIYPLIYVTSWAL